MIHPESVTLESRPVDEERSAVKSLNRALNLLEAFTVFGPEIGLSEMAARLTMNKATVYRLLGTLEARGFVERSPNGRRYRLGVRVFELGAYYQGHLDVRKLTLPYMLEMGDRTHEAIFLCIRDGNEALCIERVEAKHDMEYFALRVGGRIPLHVGGAPRVLLSAMSDKEIEDYAVQTGLPALTSRSITSTEKLLEDIQQVRRQDYAISVDDVTPGIAAIGAPVRDYSGKIIASVSVSGLTVSLKENMPDLIREIVRTANLSSRQMGYAGADK